MTCHGQGREKDVKTYPGVACADVNSVIEWPIQM
jgi:hypothetical protein